MKRKISSLISKYSIEAIEHAYVQSFVSRHGLRVRNNEILLEVLNFRSTEIDEVKSVISAPESLNELVQVFELLIPKEDRKLNGAFFTPDFITNFMAGELVSSADVKICDPSCGCGAFLVATAEVMVNRFSKSVREVIENNIYGVDVLDYSIRRSKVLLSLLLLMHGDDSNKFKFNIYSMNSLNADWCNLFPEIFQQGGFDVVIGNPPYVKYQDLPGYLRKDLYDNWQTLKKGTYNLYFAFFELGFRILNKTGRLGYIVPNNYFTSLAGVNLREFLQRMKYLDRIIDFNHLQIFDVQTYTCITFASKKAKSHLKYERVDSADTLKSLKDLVYSFVCFDNLNPRKWRLLREVDQANIKIIESLPRRLGEIADVRVGVATCKDNVYFVDGNTLVGGYYRKPYNGKVYLIEAEITRPIAKISDFDDQDSLNRNSRRIIYPYYLKNGKAVIIPEDELKSKFPKCYEYLLVARPELETRDKGNGNYPAWYAYARTQGLNFHGEKLLTPTFSDRPRFLYSSNKEEMFCNGYGIYEKRSKQASFGQNLSLRVLQKILSSKVMDYYISRTSFTIQGGYPCYQKNFIELFGIPDFKEDEILYLENESSKERINEFLIRKYQINI